MLQKNKTLQAGGVALEVWKYFVFVFLPIGQLLATVFDNRPMVVDNNDTLVLDSSTWLFLINQHLFSLMHRCLENRHTGQGDEKAGLDVERSCILQCGSVRWLGAFTPSPWILDLNHSLLSRPPHPTVRSSLHCAFVVLTDSPFWESKSFRLSS